MTLGNAKVNFKALSSFGIIISFCKFWSSDFQLTEVYP